MHTVLLIAAGLALAYFARPKDKQSYQMAILAIIGIAYFCIWRFADFYTDIFLVDNNIKNISFFLLMFSAVVIGLFPWVRAISRNHAYVLTGIFAICAVLTFSLEKNIKNTVAGWGGYFDDPASELRHSVNQTSTQIYHHESGGFTINIPDNWQKKKHDSGLDYFELQIENKAHAELRPRCFHNTELSIPEIISNIINWDQSQTLEAKKQCFLSSSNFFTCFITSHGNRLNSIQERWRWLLMDKSQSQNIELDFIFYSNNEQGRRDAEAIINSLVFKPLTSPLPLCISPVDWF
jgi:hypothetical protein